MDMVTVRSMAMVRDMGMDMVTGMVTKQMTKKGENKGFVFCALHCVICLVIQKI